MIIFANCCPDGQQLRCCAYPSTPHWRSLCGDKMLYINHVPRSGSNYRASTGGRFGTAPRYGIQGVSGPHKGTTLRPIRLPCASCHCGVGGYAKPLRGSRYIHFSWRNGGISAPVNPCHAVQTLDIVSLCSRRAIRLLPQQAAALPVID